MPKKKPIVSVDPKYLEWEAKAKMASQAKLGLLPEDKLPFAEADGENIQVDGEDQGQHDADDGVDAVERYLEPDKEEQQEQTQGAGSSFLV